MTVLIANNATSRLATSISTSSTSISVQAGDGAKFPVLAGGNTFPVTLVKADGQLEICRCTARSGDVLTVQRAQESTTAKAFSAGDRIELRMTKGTWDQKFSEVEAEIANVFPRKLREGLLTEWVDTSSIKVNPGRCASVSGDLILELAAASTRVLQTSGAYVHGASGNGLLSGGRLAGWWYYMFLLRRDSDGVVAVAFDTSATAANRPAGYTHYRRIGSVRTGVSSNVLVPYTQVGNEFWFNDAVRIYTFDAVVAGTTYSPVTGTPGAISHTAHLSGWGSVGGGQPNMSIEINHPTRSGGRSEFIYFAVASTTMNQISDRSFPIYGNPSVASTLQFRVSGGSGNATLWARGYTDHFED